MLQRDHPAAEVPAEALRARDVCRQALGVVARTRRIRKGNHPYARQVKVLRQRKYLCEGIAILVAIAGDDDVGAGQFVQDRFDDAQGAAGVAIVHHDVASYTEQVNAASDVHVLDNALQEIARFRQAYAALAAAGL